MKKKATQIRVKNDIADYLRNRGGVYCGEFATDILEEYFNETKEVPKLSRRVKVDPDGFTLMHITIDMDVMEKGNGPSNKYNCIGQYIELAVNHHRQKETGEEFIDPKDLRIGNAIVCNGINTTVEQIREGGVKVKGQYGWYVKYDLKGVDITEGEIEVFKKAHVALHFITETIYFDFINNQIVDTSCECANVDTVKYLHQLQNFIADNTNQKLEYTP